jgi:hypothetical protein
MRTWRGCCAQRTAAGGSYKQETAAVGRGGVLEKVYKKAAQCASDNYQVTHLELLRLRHVRECDVELGEGRGVRDPESRKTEGLSASPARETAPHIIRRSSNVRIDGFENTDANL